MAKKEIEETKKTKTKKAKEVTKKPKAKKPAKKEKKEKTSLLKGVFHELSKVKWPTGKEIAKYSFITVIFCIGLILFFQLVNLFSTFIRGLF